MLGIQEDYYDFRQQKFTEKKPGQIHTRDPRIRTAATEDLDALVDESPSHGQSRLGSDKNEEQEIPSHLATEKHVETQYWWMGDLRASARDFTRPGDSSICDRTPIRICP